MTPLVLDTRAANPRQRVRLKYVFFPCNCNNGHCGLLSGGNFESFKGFIITFPVWNNSNTIEMYCESTRFLNQLMCFVEYPKQGPTSGGFVKVRPMLFRRLLMLAIPKVDGQLRKCICSQMEAL